jgi:hypothetical protein
MGPNWQREEKLWYKEQDEEWTLVQNRSRSKHARVQHQNTPHSTSQQHIRPSYYRPRIIQDNFQRNIPLTGANLIPISVHLNFV